ncbi:MAG: T9SS type A sorting domain-containing protein [bacterium]
MNRQLKILLFFLLFTNLPSLVFAQQNKDHYIPLALGNKWQLFEEETLYAGGTTSYRTSIKVIEITDTATYNNKLFYLFSERWIRYDADSLKSYCFNPNTNSESIYVDFSVPNEFSYNNYFGLVNAYKENLTIFGISDTAVGFKHVVYSWPIIRNNYLFSKNIGFSYYLLEIHETGATGTSTEQTLIGFFSADSNIAISQYDNAAPTISIQGCGIDSLDNIVISANVNHAYSREPNNLPGYPYPSYGNTFIDSVTIEYFYSDDINTLGHGKVKMDALSYTKFKFSMRADYNLFDHNYKFYYRITATDLSLCPHTTSYPLSGFTGAIPIIVGIDEQNDLTKPAEYVLDCNYPNPFNPSTTINFALSKNEFVTLKIYDVLGKEVAVLVNEELTSGNYSKNWDASGFSSGIYFYSLKAGSFVETRKMSLVK